MVCLVGIFTKLIIPKHTTYFHVFIEFFDLFKTGFIRHSIEVHQIPQLQFAFQQIEKIPFLFILGAHSVIQTIAEQVFDKTGQTGTKFYIEHFVDGPTAEAKFSTISEEIHNIRNIFAHRWSSKKLHETTFDNSLDSAWKREGNTLAINMRGFGSSFLKSWQTTDGRIFDWDNLFEKEQIDLRIQRLIYIKNWLNLKNDPIANEIKKLKKCTGRDIENRADKIKNDIITKFLEDQRP